MGKQQKAVTREKDPLIELPDGVLSTIISMLTLKEAIRTSLLSRSWRFVWTSHPNLLFDSLNVLGNTIYIDSISCRQPKFDRQLQRRKFMERVDHVMYQRRKGPKIGSLAIHFHLGKDFACQIDRWIKCAVSRGVEKIDLDFSEWCSFKVDYEPLTVFELYTFSSRLLDLPEWDSVKECTLKHLKLASCSLSSLRISNNLTSLLTVELRDMRISDQHLENFLSSCLFLENLSLHHCEGLVNFNFGGPRFRLKRLSIQNCFRLKNVEIYAENLIMLEYTGQMVSFFFENVPRLAQVFLNFTGKSRMDGVTYALTRFPYDLPRLETLNLISILAMKILKLPEEVPAFTNIKQLVLTVFPFQDEDELCWITYILKAFPLLQKLQLNLFSPNFVKQTREIDRHPPECPHRNLNELEINGFYGNQHEADLLKYLLDNAVGLEVLVINPCQKLYKGFDGWDYEEASSWHKFSMKSVEWLHATVPPTVHLIIR